MSEDGVESCAEDQSVHNELALLALLEKTGYSMVQENGQRKFGGPPPGKELNALRKWIIL